MSDRNKYTLYVLAGMLCVVLVLLGVYTIIDFVPALITDSNLTSRGIDSPAKMWLNGYLGHFFRFKFLGNINWLMLPILVHFFITIKKRERWEMALVFMFLLSILLIAVQGFFNYRYAQTLMPFTTVLVLVSIWRFFDENKIQFLRKYVMGFLVILVLFNTWHYLPWGGNAGKVTLIEDQEIVTQETVAVPTEQAAYKSKREVFKEALLSGNIPNLRDNRTPFLGHPDLPADLLEYIQNLELAPGDQFLTNNISMIYYYTDQKAMYYWCLDDVYCDVAGYHQLFEKRSADQVYTHLRHSLHCSHVLTRDIYNTYSKPWNEFLQQYATLSFKDQLGFEVWTLNEAR
jgi:hypothetical protein